MGLLPLGWQEHRLQRGWDMGLRSRTLKVGGDRACRSVLLGKDIVTEFLERRDGMHCHEDRWRGGPVEQTP